MVGIFLIAKDFCGLSVTDDSFIHPLAAGFPLVAGKYLYRFCGTLVLPVIREHQVFILFNLKFILNGFEANQ